MTEEKTGKKEDRNIVMDFIERTGMSAYSLAAVLKVGRSTLSGWIKGKPRYPVITELALKQLEREISEDNKTEQEYPTERIADDVGPIRRLVLEGTRKHVKLAGHTFTAASDGYYHGIDRSFSFEFMDAAIFEPESDSYETLVKMIREYDFKRRLMGS